ncbi:MAG: peptidoglycan DD-metalloendopeptidase family protein [Pseudomonadales bacterium]|nr:peptidoglycan DD-metalloendopeptidase family protein [Pseudomonadales bacterium]
MTKTRLLPVLFMLLISSTSWGLPQNDPVPGGVAVLAVEAPHADNLHFKGSPVMVIEEDGNHYAIVGISLAAEPGRYALHYGDEPAYSFTVNPRNYAEQRLTIENKRKVNPYQEDLERIRRESSEMNQAFTNFDRSLPVTTEFELPAEGPVSSPFGLKRFLNDQPRSPHSGLDIAADTGEPIKAPAPGKVTATGDYFFNGKTVIEDHGQGLVTMYGHMSRIDVKSGDMVEAGEIIGAIGQTGRVTGPHLHWSVSLNNARVNPNLFLDRTP